MEKYKVRVANFYVSAQGVKNEVQLTSFPSGIRFPLQSDEWKETIERASELQVQSEDKLISRSHGSRKLYCIRRALRAPFPPPLRCSFFLHYRNFAQLMTHGAKLKIT